MYNGRIVMRPYDVIRNVVGAIHESPIKTQTANYPHLPRTKGAFYYEKNKDIIWFILFISYDMYSLY